MKINVVINSKLEVRSGEETYKSTVQDVSNKNLLISVPVINGVYLTLKTGEEIDLIYYDNKANIFNFKCKTINKVTENGIPFYSVSLPYDVVKIQRRNYVRVDTVQVIKHIRKYDEEVESNEGDILPNALLLDLSGGGMRIKLREKLSTGDRIIAKISSDIEAVPVKGEVMRVDKTDDKKYIYGISFYELDNSIREKIIGIVFKIMRKQRELR